MLRNWLFAASRFKAFAAILYEPCPNDLSKILGISMAGMMHRALMGG